VQASIVLQHQSGHWYLLFNGVAAGNGYGDPIDASRAAGMLVTTANVLRMRFDLRLRSQCFSSLRGRSHGHVPRMCPGPMWL
jgi:hypothetical protein